MRRPPILVLWLVGIGILLALLVMTGAFRLVAVVVVLAVALLAGFLVFVRAR